MTALYLRCDKCGADFPEGVSEYGTKVIGVPSKGDYTKLVQDALANGWRVEFGYGSRYSARHFCSVCRELETS